MSQLAGALHYEHIKNFHFLSKF